VISNGLRNGLIVAACHVAIVASLGAKLQVDRATRPRVWARTAPVDPNLPIRGRYVRLLVEAEPAPPLNATDAAWVPVVLSAADGRLVATSATEGNAQYARVTTRNGQRVAVLQTPVAYFIPEHAQDPSILRSGEELWVEVTVPRAGGPRPIRLGVKKDGVLTPIDIR